MPMVAARHSQNSREKEASRRRYWRLPQRTTNESDAPPRRHSRSSQRERARADPQSTRSDVVRSRSVNGLGGDDCFHARPLKSLPWAKPGVSNLSAAVQRDLERLTTGRRLTRLLTSRLFQSSPRVAAREWSFFYAPALLSLPPDT